MEKIVSVQNNKEVSLLFGRHDENLKLIEKQLNITITSKGEGLRVCGSQTEIEKAEQLLNYLLDIIRRTGELKKKEILFALKMSHDQSINDFASLINEKIDVSAKNIHISPKTKGQKEYIQAIKDYDITFGIGPAGTGKTYLAMAMAVNALKKGLIRRIILTRPALEAGESLGFLPGDMYEKIAPYLRPLYDALYDMMDAERIEKYVEMKIIEVVPLAYMRGRTLNDAFIILDEAQNCTTEQIKMFLTRLGFDSKTVITGDITQSDLPGGRPKGLIRACEVLTNIEGIKFIQLTGADVVRHELVQQIIEAYERADKKEN
jgi:phosphate starvation-inducible PhoH-like protein